MRLIDVQATRQAPHGKDPAGAANSTSASATRATGTARIPPKQSFALRALSKFLDALLQFVFVAPAKVLRSSLRAADAHRFGRRVGADAVQGQCPNVSSTRCASSGIDHASSQRRQRVIERQALKTLPCCGQYRSSHVALLLLA